MEEGRSFREDLFGLFEYRRNLLILPSHSQMIGGVNLNMEEAMDIGWIYFIFEISFIKIIDMDFILIRVRVIG